LMTPRSTRFVQIDSLYDSVYQALARLKAGKFDTGLLDRIQARFQNDLNRGLKQIASLRDKIRETPDNASLETAWAAFGPLRSQSEAVLSECLAFIEGALARTHGVDAGLCRLTDSLLYDLSGRSDIGWNRFTILADGEFFACL